ncbi:hypothetical protein WJX79_010781 [Trebouxia sp. C0005]
MIAATVDLQQGQQAVRDAVLDNPSKRRPALCFDGLCEKETSDPKVMDAWSHEIDELILGEDIKKSDGLFLFDKAESGSDCLHVPTNVNLAALAALIRMLQRHRKLDPSFHATLETKSRNSTQKVIDLKEAPGHMHPLEAMQYGRVDATSVLSRIRQRTHAASLQTGGAVMTQTKLDQLASLSRCNKYGLGSPPEVVMARLRKRLLTVLQAKNQDFGLSSI